MVEIADKSAFNDLLRMQLLGWFVRTIVAEDSRSVKRQKPHLHHHRMSVTLERAGETSHDAHPLVALERLPYMGETRAE